MANQKLQVGKALNVIKSDNDNIPFPNIKATGYWDTPTVEDILDDPEATFITNGVAVGDIVYFPISATPVCATVIKVISETQLLLNQSIGPYGGWSEFYNLYDGSFSEGCVLYVGGAGDVSVTTVGGNDVTFKGINAGQFIPVNVVKVTASTTATDIIALW